MPEKSFGTVAGRDSLANCKPPFSRPYFGFILGIPENPRGRSGIADLTVKTTVQSPHARFTDLTKNMCRRSDGLPFQLHSTRFQARISMSLAYKYQGPVNSIF